MSKKRAKFSRKKEHEIYKYDTDILTFRNNKILLAFLLSEEAISENRIVLNLNTIMGQIDLRESYPNNNIQAEQEENPLVYAEAIVHALKYLKRLLSLSSIDRKTGTTDMVYYMRCKLGRDVYDRCLHDWIDVDMPRPNRKVVTEIMATLATERYQKLTAWYHTNIAEGLRISPEEHVQFSLSMKKEYDKLSIANPEVHSVSLTDKKSVDEFKNSIDEEALNTVTWKFAQRELTQFFGGGLIARELTLIIAPTGGGKSMTCTNLSTSMYKRATTDEKMIEKIDSLPYRPVFAYVTLENSLQMDCSRTLAAMFPDVSVNYRDADFSEKLMDLTPKIKVQPNSPRLEIIKLSSNITTAFIDNYLTEIESKCDPVTRKPFKVCVLLVDYLGVMDSTSTQEIKRHQLGTISTELKGLADARKMAVITCVQTNKTAAMSVKETIKNSQNIKDAAITEYDASESSEVVHNASRVVIVYHNATLLQDRGKRATAMFMPKARDGNSLESLYVQVGKNGIGWVDDFTESNKLSTEAYPKHTYLIDITNREEEMPMFMSWLKYTHGANPKYMSISEMKKNLLSDAPVQVDSFDGDTVVRMYELYATFKRDKKFKKQYLAGNISNIVSSADIANANTTNINISEPPRQGFYDSTKGRQSSLPEGFNIR